MKARPPPNGPSIPGGGRCTIVRLFVVVMTTIATACTSPDQTFFLYRLPFEDGTDIKIWQDHISHTGGNQIDMAGVFGVAPYEVVAARPGTIRFIADTFTVNCSSAVGCSNNYVWIEHDLGDEWSKYTHLATGTVTSAPPGGAGLSVGEQVTAGQYLGDEGNIGMAIGTNMGRHLHFEVVIPDDPETATPSGFAGDFPYELKIPRFCSVPGQIAVQDSFYVANPCPNG